MKNVAFKLSGFFLLSLLVLSCSKTETGSSQIPLKDALTSSTQNLNSAITDISASQAFQLLSINSGTTLKSGTVMTSTTGYNALIPLSLVKGVYDYTALKTEESSHYPLIRFFTKSASANNIVVNMPLSKLKNPHDLREYHQADSTLTNNFSISVSDYHNNYNNYHDYDYVNVANISIDNVIAGGLSIKSIVSPNHNKQYASQFDFTKGYTAKYLYSSGDTTISSFTILKTGGIIYQEKLLTIKKDTAKFGREHQYFLTIGNVKIVRKYGSPAEVYVNGVLDSKAVVTIIDDEDDDEESEHSITNKRDIQITFADGTVSTVSALIGNSIADISTLFTSLHQVYFAAYVVDWIAYDIYYKR